MLPSTVDVTSVALACVFDSQRGNLARDLAGQVVTKRGQRLAFVDCLSGLFGAIPRKDVRDTLGGGESPKRVAAPYWLAEAFEFGSVVLASFLAPNSPSQKMQCQQFSRRQLLVATMMRCAVAGAKPVLAPVFSGLSSVWSENASGLGFGW